jgi:hypothetical protein
VTTATPAKLDFRETEISIEGCVNAMSTGSVFSLAPAHRLRCVSAELPPRFGGKTGRLFVAGDVGDAMASPLRASRCQQSLLEGDVGELAKLGGGI